MLSAYSTVAAKGKARYAKGNIDKINWKYAGKSLGRYPLTCKKKYDGIVQLMLVSRELAVKETESLYRAE